MQGIEARNNIADMTFGKITQREVNKMMEESHQHLVIQMRTEVENHPGSEGGDRRGNDGKQPEAQAEHNQKVLVVGHQDPIHHDLHEERRKNGEDLERNRESKDLGKQALEPRLAAPE